MRWLMFAAVIAACDSGTPAALPTPVPPPPTVPAPVVPAPVPVDAAEPAQPPPTADELAVIAAELERWHANPKAIVDGPIAGTKHYVLLEPGLVKIQVPAPFVSVTYRELEREADQLNAHVGVMWIQYVTVTGNTAKITVGGYTVVPAAERSQPRECCCDQTDEFVRSRGRWKYKATTAGICA